MKRALIATSLGLLIALAGPHAALAGEGHDHGDGPAAPSANGPQRQPDGSVFLPKPAQRQLGVRTLVAAAAALPRTLELNARVLMDPNAGGKVQALNAGRIEPGPRGLPNPGQAVRKGEVLAHVLPSAAPIERSNQAAQLAELRAAKALADKRVARLQELADTVPRKEIEAVFVGASRSLREQALSLAFRAEGPALAQLAVGQPVQVFVQTRKTIEGIAVPVAALMKNPANQTIVWVKTAPERFEPRSVTTEPLDGVNAAVTSGLKPGDRVATQGATLINQVR